MNLKIYNKITNKDLQNEMISSEISKTKKYEDYDNDGDYYTEATIHIDSDSINSQGFLTAKNGFSIEYYLDSKIHEFTQDELVLITSKIIEGYNKAIEELSKR